jgi:hypothetical protein
MYQALAVQFGECSVLKQLLKLGIVLKDLFPVIFIRKCLIFDEDMFDSALELLS